MTTRQKINALTNKGLENFMDTLTLSEKSYIAEVISRYWPELNSYEVASAFTRPQRSKFLAHTFKEELEEAKEMLDNIIAFQTVIK